MLFEMILNFKLHTDFLLRKFCGLGEIFYLCHANTDGGAV